MIISFPYKDANPCYFGSQVFPFRIVARLAPNLTSIRPDRDIPISKFFSGVLPIDSLVLNGSGNFPSLNRMYLLFNAIGTISGAVTNTTAVAAAPRVAVA